MSGLRSFLPSRGIVFGIFATLATGLLGSWAGQWLADAFIATGFHDYLTVSAAFVVGAIGGAFGRHVSGLLALWLGIVAAALWGSGITPPAIGPVTSFGMALLIATAGYGLGRMVDPIWGGRSS
jgi:uncharacterized membrane protein YeaQ/YmgE (transglycosylase-associated protein family)